MSEEVAAFRGLFSFRLEPPCEFINANDRLHWKRRNMRTQTWRVAAGVQTVRAPAWERNGGIAYERAHITVSYRFPDNRRREVSNLQPTSKAIVDGLVDAGLIPDDDDTHVIGPDNRREYPNGPPRVTIRLEELAT